MSVLNALALSVGVLAGVATWLFLGPLAGALQIWVAFVAWGSFYHCGGKVAGLRNTIVGMLFGSLLGFLTLLLVLGVASMQTSLGVPLWAGIVVAVFVAIAVLAANFAPLAVIPATVYGFACLAGLALLGGKGLPGLTDASLANPLIVVWLSAIAGAIFGYVSEMIGMAMVKSAPTSAAAAA